MTVRWRREHDARAFLERARPCLCRYEAENCVIYAIANRIAQDATAGEAAIMYLAEGDHGVQGAALQTASRPMQVTRMAVDDATALVDVLRADQIRLSGIRGPSSTADAIAQAWSADAKLCMREGAHEIEQVMMPALPPGAFRPAASTDAPLLAAWFDGFAIDGGIQPSSNALADVEAHLKATSNAIYRAIGYRKMSDVHLYNFA